MKRAFLSAAVFGTTTVPALAGSGGAADNGLSAMLIEVARYAIKIFWDVF
jgi:hypothetical protein